MKIPAPVRSKYFLSHETQLMLKPKLKMFSSAEWTIKDSDESLVFGVKEFFLFMSRSKKRVLNDVSGRPILLLKSDADNWHQRGEHIMEWMNLEASFSSLSRRNLSSHGTRTFSFFFPPTGILQGRTSLYKLIFGVESILFSTIARQLPRLRVF